MKEALRRGWEINKILSRLLQTMPGGFYVSRVGARRPMYPVLDNQSNYMILGREHWPVLFNCVSAVTRLSHEPR